uniref:Laminin subunit alpha-5 n=1 Tax=Scleropages formosus TaxID=113540 RepID=A0A8C9SXP0_SCLFO
GLLLHLRAPFFLPVSRLVPHLLELPACAVRAQELPTNGVNGFSLHPPYFNLAEGTKITATATCGEDSGGRPVRDLYCKLVGGPVSGDPGQTIQGQYCDICTMSDSNRAHPITNAIDGTERWWQSPPLSRSAEFNEVNVTLDLGQLFHVAYVLIKFANSPRPDLWVLERSVDFGKNYQPWQFFASSKRDCIERFGWISVERINKDDDVICTTEYSRIVPLENGEIVVSLVNGRPGAMNFSYSPALRDFTKATNIRLRFLRTNTLLGHLMGKALRDPTVTRRYYYSIKDISIGGRCVCNGHAEACNCDCQHNTCGASCDQCCPGFNQMPWKPATTDSANECEPCNCNKHALDCYYDPEVEQRRASVDLQGQPRGGGVCLDCQHHTAGVNCERCVPGYYRSPDHPLDSLFACSPCACESEFTDGTCEDLTGRCYCKPSYTGEKCDACAEGYAHFPLCYRNMTPPSPAFSLSLFLSVCGCSSAGSLPAICDASGRCLCRPEFQGPRCEQCQSGFHSYPSCQACQCSAEGSHSSACDQVTGQCTCLPNVVGQRCDSCRPGSYGFPLCQDGTCNPSGSVQNEVLPTTVSVCKPLYWNLSPDTPYGCSSCECNTDGTLSGVAECVQTTGQCHCKANVCSGTCAVCKDGYFNLHGDNYFGCQGCQCDIGGSAGLSCGERNGRCRCRPNVEGQKCNQPRTDHYFPDLHHLKFEIEDGTTVDGRPVRFGYNHLEFGDFSWRGYAQMSSVQNKVKISVHVNKTDLYLTRFILRYINTGDACDWYRNISGTSSLGSDQSKQIIFAPTSDPTFVNVPQNSFVQPFVLNPGTWTVVIEAEGVLLDYLVLLPSAYYEAPILQIRVTEPCMYSPPEDAMVFSARVHTLGRYVFILHYHQPLHPTFVLQVFLNGGRVWQGYANATFCPHGYGCRSLIISENQIILDVTDHEILLTIQAHGGRMLWLDYVLVVPEDRYSSNYLAEEPLDKSYDFISNCGQNSFYIHPTSSSQFCRTSAASLSAFFNNGALPCACHEVGAYSDACEAFGGQCRCLPHVIGRDCSQCATGYWGFPNCRPCECGIRLCEPVTGECICPPRTVRPDCVQCEPQTFGCHPLVGCEVCNCSRPGVTAQDISCDTDSGQCRCKNNIVGRRCDRCAPGFYGYPNCRLCDCNEAGTESDICDARTGRCLCKENVEGAQCDQCRVGTFHLDPTNPKGCTSCFCFGATDRCRSSEKRWTEFMDMRGWTLLGGDRQEVPVSTDVDKSLVEADLRDVPDVYQDLHWHAPHSYLGDKVSSYGGYLRYYQHSQTQPTRGDMLELPPEASLPLPGASHTQGSFRHSQTGNPVSREELMMVLVALEALQIRALHSQSSLAVTLRRVVLESASQSSTGKPASNVEMCLCPANYKGDSCQQCAPGYYRDTKGLFLGKCVPCNCNGHSDQCLDGSGICVNCQHNTAGDHCEKCQGGFLDNGSLDGHAVSCSSCPCPLQVTSNNFAVRCVEKPNHMQCLCMPGYAGPKCERCAPGFYGNPMVIGSTCQPCQCHDNTDPNMLFSDCHPLTGVCQGCMHNTTGPYCEVCAPGFYGDAITAKNLKEELVSRLADNQALVQKIRDRLGKFHAELMDLRDALNQAVNNTARAAETNNINAKRLEENLVRGAVHKPKLHLNSPQECEHLAAQLDGARLRLAEKVQRFASATSKIALVEKAEEHAEMLNQLAKNLSRWVFLGRRAVNASRAYSNIIEAIQKAENAAHEAYDASMVALEVRLDKLQNHSMQMPNISENIERIRELIAQARRAASKVNVPVKFNGTAGVQVRNPQNLADLAAYTSLKLYITLPESSRKTHQADTPSQFVFYLGNKNRNDSNHFIFKTVTKADVEAGGDLGLLNLPTEETVFYVGGYPDSFDPPPQLKLPGFQGCIELDTLNEEVLSLYNFERTFQLNTTEVKPCGSYLNLRLEDLPDLQSNFYTGFGFHTEQRNGLMFHHQAQSVLFISTRPHFSMAVRVKSSEGLIFYASGEKGAAIVLLVSNGRFLLLINSGHRKTSIHSHKKYNDGQWHTVFVKRERDNVSLIVDGINRQSRRLSKREKSRLSRLSPPLYIGGLPVGPPRFVGCIRDVKLNEEPLQTPSHSLGVVPCFREDLQPGVYFSNLGGHLSIGEATLPTCPPCLVCQSVETELPTHNAQHPDSL